MHSPSLAEGSDGTIYAAWDDFGFYDPAGPTGSMDIWLACSTDGGATWAIPMLITYSSEEEYYPRLVPTTGEEFLYILTMYDAADGPMDMIQVPLDFEPGFFLSGEPSNTSLLLRRNSVPATANYWVYGADNLQYFVPEVTSPYGYRLDVVFPSIVEWLGNATLEGPNHNWTYLIIAVNESEQELHRTNRVSEFDYEADIP